MLENSESQSSASDINASSPRAVFIKEYGVIHIRNAMSEEEQRALWAMAKPRAIDPAGRAAGFSCFGVSEKTSKTRVPEFDEQGVKLFALAAEQVASQLSAEECRNEPSYQHLLDLATGSSYIALGEVRGNCYRADSVLNNHCDCDQILFTMTMSLGADCEFTIGRRTGRSARMNERAGKEFKLRLKSGDALFFDGGSVPHEVNRIIPKTAPEWWGKETVGSTARAVVLFREQEKNFYQERLINRK